MTLKIHPEGIGHWTDREWEVEVIPLVVRQRSVKEKEWLEIVKIFGIRKEDVEDGKRSYKRIIDAAQRE